MLGGDGPVSEPLAARSTAFDEARRFSHGRNHSQKAARVPFTFTRCAQVNNLRMACQPTLTHATAGVSEVGAGNGIRTRDFDLGKVALYH